jgi:hypothetical protein
VIWIVIQHDVVCVPQPIAGVAKVVWRDAPVKAAEPETVPPSAFEAINVVATNFTAETPVFPYMVLLVALVIPAPVMSDPMIALSMNVWSLGMALLVTIRLTPLLLVATRAATALVAALCLNCAAGMAAVVASLRLS